MGMCRPSKDELDALEELGNSGWNWDSLLPYFKKVRALYDFPTTLLLLTEFVERSLAVLELVSQRRCQVCCEAQS